MQQLDLLALLGEDRFGDPLDDLTGPFDPPAWCRATHQVGRNTYQCNRQPHPTGTRHVDAHGASWTPAEEGPCLRVCRNGQPFAEHRAGGPAGKLRGIGHSERGMHCYCACHDHAGCDPARCTGLLASASA